MQGYMNCQVMGERLFQTGICGPSRVRWESFVTRYLFDAKFIETDPLNPAWIWACTVRKCALKEQSKQSREAWAGLKFSCLTTAFLSSLPLLWFGCSWLCLTQESFVLKPYWQMLETLQSETTCMSHDLWIYHHLSVFLYFSTTYIWKQEGRWHDEGSRLNCILYIHVLKSSIPNTSKCGVFTDRILNK